MRDMKSQICLYVLVVAMFVYHACASNVTMLPKINLTVYGAIGIIDFSSNIDGNLRYFVTEEVMRAIRSEHRGVRLLKLGSSARVLKSIQQDQLDQAALQAIGKEYSVDAVVTGHLEVTTSKFTDSQPTSPMPMSLDASLAMKLLEIESGNLLLNELVRGQEALASETVTLNDSTHFVASDPENEYGQLIRRLVQEATRDLQPGYQIIIGD